MTHHRHNVKLGWKPDQADHRDKIFRFGAAPVDLSTLPPKVDLCTYCSTVENQYTLGSCTANAAAAALEYLEIKDGVEDMNFENFSRLFIYYNMRAIQNSIEVDSGGSLRDTIKALASVGACDELKWNYDISKFSIKPLDECYEEASKHKIVEYHRLENFPDMLRCLSDGFPFVFGFMIYDSFMTSEVAKSGILPMPSPTDVFVGGHAVCAVGYDMEAKTVLVRNSWGSEWGQGGYFTIPFAFISNPNYAQDFWTIRR